MADTGAKLNRHETARLHREAARHYVARRPERAQELLLAIENSAPKLPRGFRHLAHKVSTALGNVS